MKIQKIKVSNFKAISEQEINLNGCSAIVTAGNDQGKTSLLRGLIDRLHSEKPGMIVKEGEEKGSNVIEMTDGSQIEWNFTKKSERLTYKTPDGFKQTTGVIGQIGEKYFGKQFDIDAFLSSGPKKQQEWMKELVDVDFGDIEERYKQAYQARTEANRELKRISSQKAVEPEKVEKPDIESIKKELDEAQIQNEKHVEAKNKRNSLLGDLSRIRRAVEDTAFREYFDDQSADSIIDSIEVPKKADTSEIRERLDEAQEQLRKYDSYERDLKAYKDWVKAGKKARKEAEKADQKVKEIEQEKQKLIEQADMPEGFDFSDDGITYNGFPLDENQISKSSKYIAGLKLGEMVLGEVRALHFDASMLDNNSLKEVQQWAEKKDLQLLIERPDYEDAGEIKYEIIE